MSDENPARRGLTKWQGWSVAIALATLGVTILVWQFPKADDSHKFELTSFGSESLGFRWESDDDPEGVRGGPVPARNVVLANVGGGDIEVAAVEVLTYPVTVVRGGEDGVPKSFSLDYVERLAAANRSEFLLESAVGCAGNGTFTVKAGGSVPLLALPVTLRFSDGNHVITMPMTTEFKVRVHLATGEHEDLEVSYEEGFVVHSMQDQLKRIHEDCNEATEPLVVDEVDSNAASAR